VSSETVPNRRIRSRTAWRSYDILQGNSVRGRGVSPEVAAEYLAERPSMTYLDARLALTVAGDDAIRYGDLIVLSRGQADD
jgi:hypothetical protein